MSLRIYFSAAVRSDGPAGQLSRRIEQLSTLGHVLTRHMASPATVDLGHQDDASIWAHDQALLEQAHVFIADLGAASTGSGYMVARATARGIPALCLFPKGGKASAMIAGAPDVTTRFYGDDAEFLRHVRAFLFGARKIFLAGPPGSGKGTLGARLAELTGAPHISTGELLRSMVKEKPEHPLTKQVKTFMDAGQLVPAELMRDIVLDRLGQEDCRLFGFVLDGYPPSLADLENLRGRITPDLVIYLDVSDATATARQVSRAARSTDTPEKAKDRLNAFHEARSEYDALASRWYPEQLVVRLDAEENANAVEEQALELLFNTSAAIRHTSSYFALPPFRTGHIRSTRVHFHVDAPDSNAVRTIAQAICARHKAAQGQLKIYPIRSLHLGSQLGLPIYRRLPNFHPIENAAHESFITGRLGVGDRALMQVVLEETQKRGGMAELEEYVGEWTLRRDGSVHADSEYPLVATDHRYLDFADAFAPTLPQWELHHGFDVPKTSALLPLALPELMQACAEAGLDNGGWFIFHNDAHWAFRSNEFRDGPQAELTERLHAQARALKSLLKQRRLDVEVGYSLERVHGIWTFPIHTRST